MISNLLISFSGGETSGFMAQWIKDNYKSYGYENIVFVFANTGLEDEETLNFVEKCDKHFNLGVHWVEARVIHEHGKGTRHTKVNYENASRNGEPFEEVIKKYGIPNQANPHCTRELKGQTINSYAKEYFNGEKYHTAIGIRIDEIDRMNAKAKERGFIYPLIRKDMIPMTRPQINIYWNSMPFRLNLKSYQGNCVTCWKKSDKKLYQIAKENLRAFEFMDRMEGKYKYHFPQNRIDKWKEGERGELKEVTFFRNNRSAKQIIEESKHWNGVIRNEAELYSYQIDLLGGESCEVWSECGT